MGNGFALRKLPPTFDDLVSNTTEAHRGARLPPKRTGLGAGLGGSSAPPRLQVRGCRRGREASQDTPPSVGAFAELAGEALKSNVVQHQHFVEKPYEPGGVELR